MGGIGYDLFAPGLWQSPPVIVALTMGTLVALASAGVGFFVVVRGQAFLGHALGDMGATGASGAALVGAQALWGFLVAGVVSGSAADLFGDREHDRDVTTGIVLAAMLGLGALFLYLVTTSTGAAGTVQTILFGSVFTADPSTLPAMAALAAFALAVVAALYRPLLYASLFPESAAARGVPVRVVGFMFMLAVVAAVEQSALVVGALLSTALLVGPAATAIRIARRPGWAMALGAGFGLAAVWAGIILAYDSYLWLPGGQGFPVSFFVTALVLCGYLATYVHVRVPGRRSVHGTRVGA